MMEEVKAKDIRIELVNANIRMYDHRFEKILIKFIVDNERLFKKHKLYSIVKIFTTKKSYYNNSAIINAYATILQINELFAAFLKDTDSYDIYFRLANNKYTTESSLSKLFKDTDDHHNFPKIYSNWQGDVYGLPLMVRKHLLHFFDSYPKPTIPLTTIPETAYVFDGQEAIFNDLPILSAYMKQHGLETLKAIKKAKTSEINKLKKNLDSREFFPKAKKLTGTLRHHFLGNLFLNVPQSLYNRNTLDLLRHLFREVYPANNYKSAFSIFSHIKGLEKYEYATSAVWEIMFSQEVKTFQPNHWYEFDSWFLNYQLERDIKIFDFQIAIDKIYEPWFYSNGYYHTVRQDVNHNINFIHERFVYTPLLKGTLFLFAAFGLIDLAYDEAITEEEFEGDIPDPYRSLKYFRLNDLGAFILGLTNTYVPPKIIASDELFLSKDALVITTHEDNKKAQILLKEYLNEAGDNRYTTDYEKFTSRCNSVLEIKEKIRDFKNIVGKVPENWQLFFDEIIENAHPIEELDQYKIFKIKNNPELIRIIARDETLKKWIIKAEQFHIIVLEKDIYKVKKRLRQLGYFIA
jgi:hypothetical protein